MKIRRIFLSHYKNLVDCEIRPQGIHAITGCNGSGKTNFLEVFQFIAALLSTSTEFRDSILKIGICPTGEKWFPLVEENNVAPFCFEMDGEISVNGVAWNISYLLEIEKPIFDNTAYDQKGTGKISNEVIKLKEFGKPGRMRMAIKRTINGSVTVNLQEHSKKPITFKTKANMPALQALEVREADDFDVTYPVLSEFRKALLSSCVVKLDPGKLLKGSDSKALIDDKRIPGNIINHFPLFDLLKRIETNPTNWEDFMFWVKRLCDIDGITMDEMASDDSPESAKAGVVRRIFIERQGQILFPTELSTGNVVLLGIVTALFSFLRHNGVIVFEEPETYIHPKAIIDLVTLFRVVAESNTVLYSTHSPVALNSMKIDEVSLMSPIGDGLYKALAVEQVSEAVAALDRGYLSFGDLLQTNFMTE